MTEIDDLNNHLAQLLEKKPDPVLYQPGCYDIQVDVPQFWIAHHAFKAEFWHWIPQDFIGSDAHCFAAVDEMARRGWCWSLTDRLEDNEPTTRYLVFMWQPEKAIYRSATRVVTADRREALVKAMIAALEAKV